MFNGIKDFIQRGRKGYTTSDLWSFDNWLSQLIARGLREFKGNCHSYPGEGVTWKEWMQILDEMIECFEEQTRNIDNLLPDDRMEVYSQRIATKREKLHRGFELLEKFYFDLWD